MRSRRLYLASRSVRESEPVFICPALVATAEFRLKVEDFALPPQQLLF